MENQKDPKIVVCDLDGTLVSTDIFHESLLRAIAADITIFLISVIRFLVTGRPAAKKYLAENTELDVDALPFNEQVLSYLHKKKQLGCRLFLVSAADKKIVNKISSHLNIFEEAHGSSEGINLKGEQKADFLLKKFGKNRFEYIGNSTADFHVWRISAKATAVGFSRTRLAKLKRINVNTISIDSNKSVLLSLFTSLRPHQWVKNLLVFLPPLLAHNFDLKIWLMASVSFFCLSLVASGTYIFNDLVDLHTDRKHPSKRNRPIPSGKVPLVVAGSLGIGLSLISLMIASLASPSLFLVLSIYFITTLFYSISLKTKIVVDIVTLSFLFTLRIVSGSVATGIETTPWLLTFSIFLFIMLAACKRLQELTLENSKLDFTISRRPYEQDDKVFLISFAVVSGQLSALVFALYLNSDFALRLYPNTDFLWVSCLTLINWVSYVTVKAYQGKMDDDQIKFILKNKVSWCCGILILGSLILGAM